MFLTASCPYTPVFTLINDKKKTNTSLVSKFNISEKSLLLVPNKDILVLIIVFQTVFKIAFKIFKIVFVSCASKLVTMIVLQTGHLL